MTRLTNASYIKITLIILLGLIFFAIAGLGSCSSWGAQWGSGRALGNALVDAAKVKNVSIDWAAGSVKVSVLDDTTSGNIELIETSRGGLTKAQSMRWEVSGDTLSVDYGTGFSCFFLTAKDLEVRIPKSLASSLGEVDIDGASGEYRVLGIECEKIKLQFASGDAFVSQVSARQLDLDAASGRIEVQGQFTDEVKAQVASGKVSIACESQAPRRVSASVASGDVTIGLPENDGFTLRMDKLSGNLQNDFAVSQQSDGTYRYKDGATNIAAEMASGNFTLRKLS